MKNSGTKVKNLVAFYLRGFYLDFNNQIINTLKLIFSFLKLFVIIALGYVEVYIFYDIQVS